MNSHIQTVHTTLNLSRDLIREAKKIFKNKTKTQIIHEALQLMIQMEKTHKHFQRYKGKGSFKSYG